MRAVVQRVSSASVTIDHGVAATMGRGLVILLGIQSGDTDADVSWLSQKVANLRVFPDEADRMNRSLIDLGRQLPGVVTAMVVSQFTLLASTRKGTRPSFNLAASPEFAVPLYERFIANLETVLGRPVGQGKFGAMMAVALVNDGPVTVIIDSRTRE